MTRRALTLTLLLAGCSGMVGETDEDSGVVEDVDAGGVEADAGAPDAGQAVDAGVVEDAGEEDAGFEDAGAADAGEPDAGFPNVDRSNPKLYSYSFKAQSIDADAGRWTGNELARLDTRVPSKGILVVYLHGAGTQTTCGSGSHQDLLAARGFHTVGPCYASDYGIGICGADIGGCRLEAFEGIDHNPAIAITPNESIEVRVVKMLQHLATLNPQGDWGFFVVDGKPRWDRIIISGISHGASTAGLIAKVRPVVRSVMLSGPLDTNQAWLTWSSVTPADRIYGFTHTGDPQHPGHLAAFEDLVLPGTPVRIEDAGRPYLDSHRLFTSVDAGDSHGSTQAGGSSPKLRDGGYVFVPVWEQMYGVP